MGGMLVYNLERKALRRGDGKMDIAKTHIWEKKAFWDQQM
jgi:hypothetical protein